MTNTPQEQIPEWAVEKAEWLLPDNDTLPQTRIDIARALVAADKAATERAEQIVEEISAQYAMDESGWLECCETIAAAIRKGAE